MDTDRSPQVKDLYTDSVSEMKKVGMKAEAVLVMQRRESCKKRAPAETITI